MCIYIYIYIYIHITIYIYIYIYVYIYVYNYMIYICVCIYIYIYIHICIHTFVHHHHHLEGVVCKSFCLNSGTSAVSEVASRRWWCIEPLFPGKTQQNKQCISIYLSIYLSLSLYIYIYIYIYMYICISNASLFPGEASVPVPHRQVAMGHQLSGSWK